MPGSATAVHRGRADSRNWPAKIPQAQGAAPRSLTSYAPVPILESAQFEIDGKQRTSGNCLAVSSPPRLNWHTRFGCATFFAQRDLRHRARANRPEVDGARGHL